jgi:hypothetical protein
MTDAPLTNLAECISHALVMGLTGLCLCLETRLHNICMNVDQ